MKGVEIGEYRVGGSGHGYFGLRVVIAIAFMEYPNAGQAF
jgi:hypothetical protein